MLNKEHDVDMGKEICEIVETFHEIRVANKLTMRDFDEDWLTPIQAFSPEEIRSLRDRENISQPIFARYMNVNKGVISAWECGTKKPGGPALRLLTVIKKYGIQAVW